MNILVRITEGCIAGGIVSGRIVPGGIGAAGLTGRTDVVEHLLILVAQDRIAERIRTICSVSCFIGASRFARNANTIGHMLIVCTGWICAPAEIQLATIAT